MRGLVAAAVVSVLGAGTVAAVAGVGVLHIGGARTAAMASGATPMALPSTSAASGAPSSGSPAAPAVPDKAGGIVGSPSNGSTPPSHVGQRGATPSLSPAAFSVHLGTTCVVPGGEQSLQAQSGVGYTVAFNSHYADGRDGGSYGGYGVLATDGSGAAHTTWRVAANAPLGTVSVDVGTGNGGSRDQVTHVDFSVSAHC